MRRKCVPTLSLQFHHRESSVYLLKFNTIQCSMLCCFRNASIVYHYKSVWNMKIQFNSPHSEVSTRWQVLWQMWKWPCFIFQNSTIAILYIPLCCIILHKDKINLRILICWVSTFIFLWIHFYHNIYTMGKVFSNIWNFWFW